MFYKKRKAKHEAQIKKLENENRELKRDLSAVAFEPMSFRGATVMTTLVHERQMANAFWSGERTDPMYDKLEQHPMNGIMFQMEKNDDKFPTEYE